MIAGETEVSINRWRQVVHFITGGHNDFKTVCVQYRAFEFDREKARLSGFQQRARFGSDHARPNQEQVASVLGIIQSFERVVESKGQTSLLKIDDRSLGNTKIRQ